MSLRLSLLQRVMLSVSLLATAPTLSHATRSSLPAGTATLAQCNETGDLNGDGMTWIGDVMAALMLSPIESAAYFEALMSEGCDEVFNHIIAELIEQLEEHSARCAAADMNADGQLDAQDAELVLAARDLTIPEKLTSIRILGTGYSGALIVSGTGAVTEARCRWVVEEGPLYIFPTYLPQVTSRLEACLDADLNGDNQLDLADLTLISDPESRLTIEERIAAYAALRDPLCPDTLE